MTTVTPPMYDTDLELQSLLEAAELAANNEGVDIDDSPAFSPVHDMLARDEASTLMAVARELSRIGARIAESQAYLDAVRREHEVAVFPLEQRRRVLDGIVKEVLASRRQRDKNTKSLTLPEFGTWKSTKVRDGWTFDEQAVLEALSPDDRERFTEQRPHLKTQDLREHLDDILAGAKEDPQLKALTEEERAQRLSEIAEPVAAIFGATYRPERISLKGPLDR